MRTQECRENIRKAQKACGLAEHTVLEVERVADFVKEHGELSPLPTNAVMPLIREKDPVVKEKAIESVKKLLEMRKNASGRFVKKLTANDSKQIINKTKAELAPIPPPIPEDKYDVILADPPWQYDFSMAENRKVENQYPTMELEKICNLKIPVTKDSVLFLWATAPKLKEALKVIESWGFEYKTHAVWNKQIIGMGYYFRGQHELLLVATNGSPTLPLPENRPSSIIVSPRTKHSRKPELIYELIEKMYPSGKYLELFARQKREGWIQWGNEI